MEDAMSIKDYLEARNTKELIFLERKEEADKYSTNCSLLTKATAFPSCTGYSDMCYECEVPNFYKEAKKTLVQLAITGKIN
jgi:hypothetical protein